MTAATTLKFERNSVIPIDPRTKIFLTLTVSTITMAGGTGGIMNIIRPCLVALPIILLLLSKRFKAAARFSITYIILYTLELLVIPMLTGVWNFILNAASGIYTHMLPGFVMGYYLISTTTVSEFVAAMERIHVPQKVVIPLSVVFRFFPTVKEEYAAIRDAMKMLEYRVVPLMMSIAKIGEELSAAALTRGLGAPEKRTNICNIGFGLLDIVFGIISILGWIGFFIK